MLRDEILATLAYYDVLDMPLTAEEVFRFLIKKDSRSFPSLSQVQDELQQMINDKRSMIRDGYYYLFDREYLVPLRNEHERLAKRKWSRLGWTMRWMRAVPFVRAVFVSGSLSMNNTDELSDLDIVIVAKHGRIWLTRLLVSVLLSLLRMRRRGDQTVAPDKICPNHFITDESLHIPFQSLYTAQLYANLVPVIADQELVKNFQMQNEWVFKYLHHWNMVEEGMVTKRVFGFSTRLGDWLEAKAREYQKHRIERNATPLRPGGHLTYSDEALAFHAQSSASEILQKYENSQSKLAIGL